MKVPACSLYVLFLFLRLTSILIPFGIAFSPAFFQNIMKKVLSRMSHKKVDAQKYFKQTEKIMKSSEPENAQWFQEGLIYLDPSAGIINKKLQ